MACALASKAAYLQAEGHRVVVALDGAQALARIRQRRPDLLLLDVMMPTVDGWQVLNELEVLGEVPVIVLSARAAEPWKPHTPPRRKVNIKQSPYLLWC